MYVDDVKMAGREHNLERVWKGLMEHVDLEKPTTLLDQVHLRHTPRECKPNSSLVDGN